MRSSKIVHGVILGLLLTLAFFIVRYYWVNDSLDAIRMLPKYIMFLFLGYVLLQVLKRWLYRDRYWWDWIYYIGLAAAMLPTFMASSQSAHIFHAVTDYGTIFLLLPVVLDLYKLKSKI
ncbi:MAG: hypothetical protein ACFHU9_04535 [Fluviicola sp.]